MINNYPYGTKKANVFEEIIASISTKGFSVVRMDDSRPWGGFLVIDEAQAPLFIETFFPHLAMEDFQGFDRLSPKILIVAPGKRLSWQYHYRRAELWKVIGGQAGVVVSDNDAETAIRKLKNGDIVKLRQGERHRLIGLDEYGIIAEIWQHTDKNHPSDEDDIVRIQDDFGRQAVL